MSNIILKLADRCGLELPRLFYDVGPAGEKNYVDGCIEHLFGKVDHLQCERQVWGDVFRESVIMCMRQEDFTPYPSELSESVSNFLVHCKSATWDKLQAVLSIPEHPKLQKDPSLNQVVLARAISERNQELAKDILRNITPAPGHDLLFPPAQASERTIKTSSGSYFYAHHMFRDQTDDNGSGLWSEMIRNGWAKPTQKMFACAITSPDRQSGFDLFDLLIQNRTSIELSDVGTATEPRDGQDLSMFTKALDHSISQNGPLEGKRAHGILTSAVWNDNVPVLQLLFDRGIGDIHRIPSEADMGGPPRRLYPFDPPPSEPPRPLLHKAAEYGSINAAKWLLDHRVRNNPDGRGTLTAYEYGQRMKGSHGSTPEKDARIEQVLKLLESAGFGPSSTSKHAL